MLQKEEDDLKDAILYFYPPFVEENDQCAMCGQLMGMSEYLSSTLSQSPPCIFSLKNGKYCLKRIGDYSMGLEGNAADSNEQLKRQLDFLYSSFVMYCGSIVNIRNQYAGDHQGFLRELRGIWDILYPCGSWHDSFLTQAFQIQPTLNIPKGKGELFLQASNILQSSQRRPGVLVGLIMYKNRVLCTQASPQLSRKLILVTPQLPCLSVDIGADLPVGIRLVTIYLSNEEYSTLGVKRYTGNRHCKTSKFVWMTHGSENHPSTTAQSRGDNAKRKEMEIIHEKTESASVGEKDKGYLSDASVESRKSKNNVRRSSNLWTPADHPTQITQGFESPPQQQQSVEGNTDQDVSISDLENDNPSQLRRRRERSVEPKRDGDINQTNVNSSNLSSESVYTKCVTRNSVSSEGSVLSPVPQSSDSKEVKGIKENKQVGDIENSSNIEIKIENTVEEKTENLEGNPPDVTLIHAGEGLSLSRTPELLSDIETVDTGLSDSESPETQTAVGSNTSSADQLKERLDFPVGVSSGVGMSGDEMSDLTEECVPPSSVNSSIRSSKHSSFKSSKFDSLTSESTVQEEDMWYPEMDDLQDAILYVQGHSEISLLLLMENSNVPDQKTIQSLWKNALPQLADLDSSLRDILDEDPVDSSLSASSYLKYDSFFNSLSGNVLSPVTSEEENFQKLASSIHRSFQENPSITDVLFQSQTAYCLGHKNDSEEIYVTSQDVDSKGLKQSAPNSADLSLMSSLMKSSEVMLK